MHVDYLSGSLCSAARVSLLSRLLNSALDQFLRTSSTAKVHFPNLVSAARKQTRTAGSTKKY